MSSRMRPRCSCVCQKKNPSDSLGPNCYIINHSAALLFLPKHHTTDSLSFQSHCLTLNAETRVLFWKSLQALNFGIDSKPKVCWCFNGFQPNTTGLMTSSLFLLFQRRVYLCVGLCVADSAIRDVIVSLKHSVRMRNPFRQVFLNTNSLCLFPSPTPQHPAIPFLCYVLHLHRQEEKMSFNSAFVLKVWRRQNVGRGLGIIQGMATLTFCMSCCQGNTDEIFSPTSMKGLDKPPEWAKQEREKAREYPGSKKATACKDQQFWCIDIKD